jgi:hypothetical protein
MTNADAPLAHADAVTDQKPAPRGQESGNTPQLPEVLAAFDYERSAELFPTRSRRARRSPIGYKRFGRAADAIRFAIETLPEDLLLGAYLEVDEQRFDKDGIRRLYDSKRYPLKRRVAARQ